MAVIIVSPVRENYLGLRTPFKHALSQQPTSYADPAAYVTCGCA